MDLFHCSHPPAIDIAPAAAVVHHSCLSGNVTVVSCTHNCQQLHISIHSILTNSINFYSVCINRMVMHTIGWMMVKASSLYKPVPLIPKAYLGLWLVVVEPSKVAYLNSRTGYHYHDTISLLRYIGFCFLFSHYSFLFLAQCGRLS